jgi:hypothetical protein
MDNPSAFSQFCELKKELEAKENPYMRQILSSFGAQN